MCVHNLFLNFITLRACERSYSIKIVLYNCHFKRTRISIDIFRFEVSRLYNSDMYLAR